MSEEQVVPDEDRAWRLCLETSVRSLLAADPSADPDRICQELSPTFSDVGKNTLRVAVKRCHTRLQPLAALVPLEDDPLSTIRECFVLADAFNVCDVPGKGKGVVAMKPLRCGELLVVEEALLSSHSPDALFPDDNIPVSPAFEERLELMRTLELAQATKSGLDAVDTHSERRKADARTFWTNAHPTKDKHALFPIVCRFNHSCVPNALFYWSTSYEKECMVVVRDVQAGEEICVTYSDFGETGIFCVREARRSKLQEGFDFLCQCEACCSPHYEESDANRVEIGQLDKEVGDLIVAECYQDALSNVIRIMELAKCEALDNPKFMGK